MFSKGKNAVAVETPVQTPISPPGTRAYSCTYMHWRAYSCTHIYSKIGLSPLWLQPGHVQQWSRSVRPRGPLEPLRLRPSLDRSRLQRRLYVDSCPAGLRQTGDGERLPATRHCSGRGLCLAGRCSCTEGFAGDDCSSGTGSGPSSFCSSHGVLLPRLRRCLCNVSCSNSGFASCQCRCTPMRYCECPGRRAFRVSTVRATRARSTARSVGRALLGRASATRVTTGRAVS